MALDRQSIEKRDFPIARRGYDPDAVDAHLAGMADEVDELRRHGGRGRGDTLASAASDQVKLIVEAAEASAAEIEREAELEARRIREEARVSASRTKADADQRASEYVAAVSDATQAMLKRVEAMESEFGALAEALRTGANRLGADLSLLQGNMGELRASIEGEEAPPPVYTPRVAVPPAPAAYEPPPAYEPYEPAPVDYEPATAAYDEPPAYEPPPAPAAPVIEKAPEPPLSLEDTELSAPADTAPAEDPQPDPLPAAPEPEPAAAPAPGPAAASSPDEEGARLIALNMALNGTPREETERYLADNFDLPDASALLDDVYARVG